MDSMFGITRKVSSSLSKTAELRRPGVAALDRVEQGPHQPTAEADPPLVAEARVALDEASSSCSRIRSREVAAPFGLPSELPGWPGRQRVSLGGTPPPRPASALRGSIRPD